ncbi:MAG: response regulator [Syntrophus sp. (in: bacteria)]|nr:response regulator [Syntrophus sp. (in: bacteria)]
MDLFKELRKFKILLIDDDKWIRDSLAMFFEGEECHLSACETAEEGLEALRNQDYRTIIADYLLPGMDGLEFFRQISESHQGALKILITAYCNQKIFSEAEAIGVEAVIQKPFTVEILKQSLYRLMKVENQKARNGNIKRREVKGKIEKREAKEHE